MPTSFTKRKRSGLTVREEVLATLYGWDYLDAYRLALHLGEPTPPRPGLAAAPPPTWSPTDDEAVSAAEDAAEFRREERAFRRSILQGR
jgi:hypothetical protein